MATLDPFHGYRRAIDDQLEDAVGVFGAFHVVKLSSAPQPSMRLADGSNK